MVDLVMTDSKLDKTLVRVLALIASHPAVVNVAEFFFNEETGTNTLDVTFDVNLPNIWRTKGESPTGVQLREVVRFHFPDSYPLDPPEVSLRPNFNRNLPHMQPWLINGRPVPCLYDGHLSELFQQEGILSILNQITAWLDKAALNALIDPVQGWEPVRRDTYENRLVVDSKTLHELVDRKGGYKFFEFNYLRFKTKNESDIIHGQISSESPKLNPRSVCQIFGERTLDKDSRCLIGKSLALAVWPGKHPSGEPIINDTYLPETVSNVDELKKRAALYGCEKEIKDGLDWLKRCLSAHPKTGPFSLAIVLLARRPFKIIGSQSPIELCPYVGDIHSPDLFAQNGTTAVRPAAQHHDITRDLLAQMSGISINSDWQSWTLIGAGSLGSKLALHLARAGHGPDIVIDSSIMSPHNAARHALAPFTKDMQTHWLNSKANLLCDVLHGLGQPAKSLFKDVVVVSQNEKEARQGWSKQSWAIVNATASLRVREALASTNLLPTRVIETLLFSGGVVGAITVEGPNRNPDTGDLAAEFYALVGQDTSVARIIFENNNATSRQNIGQGCGSLTMHMSDGRLSLLASGMSEYLLKKQRDGLPENGGEILIGRLSEDGLGLQWNIHSLPPVTLVYASNKDTWRVHIHPRARAKIEKETERWPNVETGGVLIGRFSEASRTFYVVDVLDAPEDSIRTANKFVLGIKGLRRQLDVFSKAVGWSLYCLGTWHSHLLPIGPSFTDHMAASALSVTQVMPSVLLIRTPINFHALFAESSESCLNV